MFIVYSDLKSSILKVLKVLLQLIGKDHVT
jgi:hypothetical protein